PGLPHPPPGSPCTPPISRGCRSQHRPSGRSVDRPRSLRWSHDRPRAPDPDPALRAQRTAVADRARAERGGRGAGPAAVPHRLRFVPPGRLHTAAHLLLAASVGLSIWAVPAAALALYRLGVRRRAVLDVAAILLVAGTSMLALSIDARIRDAAPEVEVLAAMGVMVVLALIPLLIGHVVGTRHELLASLRERTDSAERERETARSAADAAEREAAALVREHEAETARVRAEERTA